MDEFWLGFVRPAYILLKVANKNAVDNPHIKIPVNPSPGPNSRRESAILLDRVKRCSVARWRLTPSMSGSCGHPWLK
jgi:hypothetical protein